MKTIIIPKGFFEQLKVKISVPTIKCKVCGKKMLDTPTNRLKNLSTLIKEK